MQYIYLINSQKVKASANFWSQIQTEARRHLRIYRCNFHQWVSTATHVTCQSSTASFRRHHGSSSKHCCVVFQIL